MIADKEALIRSDFLLPRFQRLIEKLQHLAAGRADHMIVVPRFVELKNRLITLEVMPSHQSGHFKLGKHTIYRGQTHLFTGLQQLSINFFRSQMAGVAVLEDAEYLQPGQGCLEAGSLQFIAVCSFVVHSLVAMAMRNGLG